MESYTGFAEVYDMFMDNIPYEQWGDFIIELLRKEGIGDGLILDLGCGTGRMTRLLACQGYDMIGVDASMEMLEIAQEKQAEKDLGILYLNQDMREFELYGTVRAIVSCCDCINYITDEADLIKVFQLVNNYLDPGGIFIFDFNTRCKYQQMGDATFAENRDNGSFIWENYYDEKEGINEYDLTLFVKRKEGLYEKYEEAHLQKSYTLEDMKRLLKLAGMELETAYNGYKNCIVRDDSERICIVAREHGKEQT